MLILLAAQLASVPAAVPAEPTGQDKLMASEVIVYSEWRHCVLKTAHHESRSIKDHAAVADLAIKDCETKQADYQSSLLTLAQYYKLGDPADFARRNGEQVRDRLRALALNELK